MQVLELRHGSFTPFVVVYGALRHEALMLVCAASH